MKWNFKYPVLELCRSAMPDFLKKETEDGVIDALVEKYRAGAIKSVLHFRRIIEAYQLAESQRQDAWNGTRAVAISSRAWGRE